MLRVFLLVGWACAVFLLGIGAGVTRADLLLVVPAAVMLVALVVTGVTRPGTSRLALTLTIGSAAQLAVTTWGPVAGTLLTVTATVVADMTMSFLRLSGRRSTGPRRA
ncbi:hypothetical protein FAF44_03260 [Nonomuraea sp. MG754425]|uniref:hypothetical protein n=1 Tax=Nonomuraea sp. MG754425 TaxID=2570319 RepID=UPI001F3A1E00|nr:hypothetical protein [Nonomuraea sp. MG754425]MCF6467433.1 hypothetical protein [Nonomuraea sp. MG754425]